MSMQYDGVAGPDMTGGGITTLGRDMRGPRRVFRGQTLVVM
jgi:hypothetical protein